MRLYDLLSRGCAINPSGVAFSDHNRQLTYLETRQAADRVARKLRALGLEKESIVATCSPNHVLMFIAVLGIIRAGCLWMPINEGNGRDEIKNALANHGTEFIFYHSSVAEIVEPLVEGVESIVDAVLIDGMPDSASSLDAWISDGDDRPIEFDQADDIVVAIRSTGGTTGPSKGVMITNRNYAMLFAGFLSCVRMTERPVHLAAAPLSHAAGSLCFLALAYGGENVILPKAAPADILAAIEERRVTHLFLPPTLLFMLLDSPEIGKHDYSSLQCLVYAGAPVPVERLKEAIRRFGSVLMQGYGQAEAPFFCTCLTPEDHMVDPDSKEAKRLESCGRATPFTRVAILGDDGTLLPDGEQGEIVIRGDIVMKGYYQNPVATAEISRGGWHRTGDIGYRDEDGYVYIVDRKRDLIISDGASIAPVEIERVLWRHPAVHDCVVIGVPDKKRGEAIKAVVEPEPDASVDESELRDLCRAHLGAMKTPHSVEFWPALPRSPVGKVLKRDIRAKFWPRDGRKV